MNNVLILVFKLLIFHYFQEDEKLISQFITDRVAEINNDVDTDVDDMYEALEQLRNIMAFEKNETTSRLVEFLQFCTGNSTSAQSSAIFLPSEGMTSASMEQNQYIDTQHPWLNVTRQDQCNEAYRKFRNHIDDVILDPYSHIQHEQEFFVVAKQYKESSDYSEEGIYSECFALIEEGKVMMDLFITIMNLVSRVVQEDVEESLNTMEEVMEHFRDFNVSEPVKDFDIRLNQTCGWRKDFSEIVRENSEMYKAYITQGRFSLLQLETPLLRYFIKVILVDWDNDFNVRKYLAQNITKQQLAEHFFSKEDVRENFSYAVEEMEDHMNQYLDHLYLSLEYLSEGYVSLTRQRPIAIINDTSIQRLHLIQKAFTNEWLARFASRGHLRNTIYHIGYEIERGTIWDMNNNVTNPLIERQEQLKIVETNLREYQDSIKMDSHFYL